ncbi:MAG: MotA/TolQ/ExbB proton channel family protein [Methylotenera sp.]|uniref:MotA/TolQ/ExbB proton channel family protein n=1 Tax=Methylotenera sp. TaxID=2051956 RepID=UPI002731C3BD|nr:MotA/TolQ/ExbB proton channel family protein [Methylotenera sp.]MDP1524104.1 MotA/TolQ/ExbB proton channel family protein [Methylotenera sp.]MDP3308906.1 MotA/TolQ/ExbB proton channel family protein [Methylotenera sp.]MDZ4211460.1 MotA/TolQ/ExbB proton channel family protein [Methylotenera sp.]
MQNGYEFNSWDFIVAGGPVSIAVAVILLVMSVASWYLIVTKIVKVWQTEKKFRDYVQKFWNATSLAATAKLGHKTALANISGKAIASAEHHKTFVAQNAEKVTLDEFVARAMNRSIAEENLKLEQGLTVLASVGSVSPFVGLFGTVWGIYHALASISLSGQATLDKVAGPVGEALIMTALGLAVAIPAVLAYNALVRSNRELSGEMEKFAYELHALLTTGAVIADKQDKVNSALGAKEPISNGRIHNVEVPA